MSNLIRHIDQISHFSQVDWLKKCYKSIVKMDMSINKKRPIIQLELFEKPRILIVGIFIFEIISLDKLCCLIV
jgi:hypothetical protein